MKQLTEQLKPTGVIGEFIKDNKEWAQERARQLDVLTRYVVTQSLLHLPYYEEVEISDEPERTRAEIDKRVTYLGEGYGTSYGHLFNESGIDSLSSESKLKGRKQLAVHDGARIVPVRFGDVEPHRAKEVYDNLHYIRSARTDSVADYGLYLDEAEMPYACVSFSPGKRGYQVDSLNKKTGLELDPSEVLSMTRAFAFNNAPHNSMSKLFHLSHEQIKKDFPECKAVVTALNPYTGFEGGIFTGSSYTPYMLSPMEYWYDEEGFYVPRSKGVQLQKTPTPPIIWLAHGLDKETAAKIDSINIDTIPTITKEEYGKG